MSQSAQKSSAVRVLLEGVPRVGFYEGGSRCPEDIPFVSCLRACAQFFGDDMGSKQIQTSDRNWKLNGMYTFLMGVSGCAFRLSWAPGWQADNVDIMYMSDEPEGPHRRAFEAIGYRYDWLSKKADEDSESVLRQAIVETIQSDGRPALAFGVVGPPECCIISGFDEGGETLIGWNYFQNLPEYSAGVGFEPTGEFRKHDWFAGTDSVCVLKERGRRPHLRDSFRKALVWALQVTRTPSTWHNRHNGLAAYHAWANHVLCFEEFTGEETAFYDPRFEVHGDAVGMVAEGRWYAAQFMRLMAEHAPAFADEALAAAERYETEHSLMWEIWKLTDGPARTEIGRRKFEQSDVRQQIAHLITQAHDQDARGAEHLQKILDMF